MNPSRLFALLIALALLVPASFAMIKTWSVPDLVRKAEYIVIAKVAQQTEIALDPKTQISTVKNVLIPEKVLKGGWATNEPIVLMTRKCGEPGQPGWLEDQPDVPPKGFRVIVFLQKGDDGSLQTVNLVQGLWPLDKNKPLGMGFGTTMAQLEGLIKEQKN
ncbi:MAG: hypothetical protein GX442_14540 [Candidatus Riflebacteria bacterium]|nr:hypothetical protein [Candidatus Riflebacteria bacterium]